MEKSHRPTATFSVFRHRWALVYHSNDSACQRVYKTLTLGLAYIKARCKDNVSLNSGTGSFQFAVESRVANNSSTIADFATKLIQTSNAANDTAFLCISQVANVFEGN